MSLIYSVKLLMASGFYLHFKRFGVNHPGPYRLVSPFNSTC